MSPISIAPTLERGNTCSNPIFRLQCPSSRQVSRWSRFLNSIDAAPDISKLQYRDNNDSSWSKTQTNFDTLSGVLTDTWIIGQCDATKCDAIHSSTDVKRTKKSKKIFSEIIQRFLSLLLRRESNRRV